MNDRALALAVVLALFDLTRAGLEPSIERLSGRLGSPERPVRRALERLRARGLVRELRLTLIGLALAASLDQSRIATIALAA